MKAMRKTAAYEASHEMCVKDVHTEPNCEDDMWEDATPSFVYGKDGSTFSIPHAIFHVTESLASTRMPLNVADILNHTGIDLDQQRNAFFKNVLRKSEAVVVQEDNDDNFTIKRIPPLGVECESDLKYLFSHRLPHGLITTKDGDVVLVVSESELSGAYDGVEADVDHMITENDIGACMIRGSKSRVLVPRTPAASANEELMKLWDSVQDANDSSELCQKLAEANIRTSNDISSRKERSVRAAKSHKTEAKRNR